MKNIYIIILRVKYTNGTAGCCALTTPKLRMYKKISSIATYWCCRGTTPYRMEDIIANLQEWQ